MQPRRLNINVGVLGHVDSGKTSLGKFDQGWLLHKKCVLQISSTCSDDSSS